jgi:two-component system, LytTR family, sensor kinase
VRRRWIVWLLVLAAWTALATFFAASSSLTFVSSYQAPQWRFTLLMALTEWYAWAALTPLVAWLARRFPLRPATAVSSLAVHAPAGVVVAFLKVTLTRLLRLPIVATRGYFLIGNLATHYLIYWSIVIVVQALAYYRDGEERAAALEGRLSDARLQLLKMQLQPHFLFNTLNTISELVHEDPATADRMIGALGQLLRESLDAGAADEVTLAQELALLDRYVDIQRARYGDRLRVQIAAADDARAALVPHFILQPIVENAIRHGIGSRIEAGRIEVRASRDADRLVIDVDDDGAGIGAGATRDGVGLGNTRARLQALYGSAQTVDVGTGPRGGTAVRLSIPWHADARLKPSRYEQT